MTTKRKTLTGYTDRAPAPDSYMSAIGFALEKKNIENNVGTLCGSRRRLIAEHYRKGYANRAKQLREVAKRKQLNKNAVKPHEPFKAKPGRFTPPHARTSVPSTTTATEETTNSTQAELTVS